MSHVSVPLEQILQEFLKTPHEGFSYLSTVLEEYEYTHQAYQFFVAEVLDVIKAQGGFSSFEPILKETYKSLKHQDTLYLADLIRLTHDLNGIVIIEEWKPIEEELLRVILPVTLKNQKAVIKKINKVLTVYLDTPQLLLDELAQMIEHQGGEKEFCKKTCLPQEQLKQVFANQSSLEFIDLQMLLTAFGLSIALSTR